MFEKPEEAETICQRLDDSEPTTVFALWEAAKDPADELHVRSGPNTLEQPD